MRHPILSGVLLVEGVLAFCALGFELGVARLVAPHVGMSTDTWTAIIAAFLGAWALGNAIGGRIAAAAGAHPLRIAAAATALAAVGVALAPALVATADTWIVAPAPQARWRIALVAALPCIPPGLCFGIAAPLLMTTLIGALRGDGLVIGIATAIGAAGSALGALATLWVLLDLLGVRGTCMAISALALLATGLLLILARAIGDAARAPLVSA